jgi:hypothetical protein
VSHIRPGETQETYVGRCADLAGGVAPNGIALEPDGSFLLAHLGTDQGGAFRLRRSGQLTPLP